MGTRADFYVGRGVSAEWLGSIAWDGYSIPDAISTAADETSYRAAVVAFIGQRKDGTKPADGWPWPWDDSRTTDYAYAFDCGAVHASIFGHAWWLVRDGEPDDDGPKVAVFPNMAGRANVTLGERSGVIVVGVR